MPSLSLSLNHCKNYYEVSQLTHVVSLSSKFSSKIQYVNTLAELHEMIPMEYVHIPDSIVK